MKLTRREALATAAVAALAIKPSHAAEEGGGVGSVSDIINVAWGTVSPEPRYEIEFEDGVYMNELIETDDESAVVIKFSDGSKLTVGENAKVTIDKYVYDPTAGSGSQAISVAKGAFRFLSGSIPKDQVKLQTPTVTIGIRGTEFFFDVADDGETELSTVAGEVDCTDGSGETLTVRIDESIVVDRNRRFRGRVRRFRHRSRSLAIAEGLDGARKRWRIRIERKRRERRRRRRRRDN